jgi:hypothetical protein
VHEPLIIQRGADTLVPYIRTISSCLRALIASHRTCSVHVVTRLLRIIHLPPERVRLQRTAAAAQLKYLSLGCVASAGASAHAAYRTVSRTRRPAVLARKPWVDVRDVHLGRVPHEERVPARRGDARSAGRQRPKHARARVRRPAHLHGAGFARPRDVLGAGRARPEELLDLERIRAPGALGARARERAHLCAEASAEHARGGTCGPATSR